MSDEQEQMDSRERAFAFQEAENNLDRLLTEYFLFDSFQKFVEAGEDYPYATMKGLKPGSKGDLVLEDRVVKHNTGFVILSKHTIPPEYKSQIRFRDRNRVTKDRLIENDHFMDAFYDAFDITMTNPESERFPELIQMLLKTDYGVLIQPDPSTTKTERYAATHYRVKIDWPLDAVVEDLGKELGYIKRHLYEQGESVAEQMETKFFDYYGFHPTAGGRRTAAITASQLLKRAEIPHVVYVASSEARSFTKINNGVERFCLLKLSEEDIAELTEEYPGFAEQYVRDGLSVFRVAYTRSKHAKPSSDARELTHNNWLKVQSEDIMPLPNVYDAQPIPQKRIYKRS